ncbi:hypothetical protein GCM10009665_67660 [Kitasatospora nipponensis]|uniref:Dynamin family protein n=1 Tax=Kitasatospora nipponensis TaxID=258049 RepID=A0ABN1WZ03_9ACTN
MPGGGGRWPGGRPGGGIPRDPGPLGAAPGDGADLLVEATGLRLGAGCVLVDTPGMDSLSGLDESALAALAEADALLYVMPHPGAGDAEALQALRGHADARLTALNAVGVLSRIDLLGDGVGDPWARARRVAATNAERLTGLVDGVLPVVGLLAQTALGDDFTEADAALLRRLSAVPPQESARALYSATRFRQWPDGPLTESERRRLLGLLGPYGIDVALGAVRAAHRAGRQAGAAALLAVLREASGIGAVTHYLRHRFVGAADGLRAVAALGALEAAFAADAQAPADAARLARERIGALRRHPALRRHELAQALADVATRRLDLPAELLGPLVALATGGTPGECLGLDPAAAPAEVRRAAAAATRHWRRLEDSPRRDLARHARTARELCEALYFGAPATAGR